MTKLWFRQRSYGWGWFPITIEGWISVVVFIIGVFYFANIEKIFMIFVLVIGLIILGYLKGPKPKWHWGRITN